MTVPPSIPAESSSWYPPDDGDPSRVADLRTAALASLNATVGYAPPQDVPAREGPGPAPAGDDDPAIVAEAAARARLVGLLDDPGFWEARDLLRRVRQHARAVLVPPWGVLGYVLARACASVPPSYVLPPTVGARGSLNAFFAFVGHPGQGKGASRGAAHDLFDVLGPITPREVTAGSGEGLAKTFALPTDEDAPLVQAAVMDVAEVDTLGALATRQGSTLLGQLRQAWSGEALGFNNASKDTRTHVPAHGYRLAVTVGVQPDRAGVLLDDAGGGTPQRFVWLPMWDVPVRSIPDTPPQLTWTPPVLDVMDGFRTLDVAPEIRAWLVSRRQQQLTTFDATLDAHAPFARLKLAGLFALLDDRTTVTPDDWDLAARVLEVSDATRDYITATTTATAARDRASRARDEASRRVAVDDATHELVVSRIMRRLDNASEPVSRSSLRSGLSRPNRETFDEVMPALVLAGRVGRIVDEYRGREVEKFYATGRGS